MQHVDAASQPRVDVPNGRADDRRSPCVVGHDMERPVEVGGGLACGDGRGDGYLPDIGGIETHVDVVGRRLAALGHHIWCSPPTPPGRKPRYEERQGFGRQAIPRCAASQGLLLSPALGRAGCGRGHSTSSKCRDTYARAPVALGVASAASHSNGLTLKGSSSRVRTMMRASQWMALRPLLRNAAALSRVRVRGRDFVRRLGLRSLECSTHKTAQRLSRTYTTE